MHPKMSASRDSEGFVVTNDRQEQRVSSSVRSKGRVRVDERVYTLSHTVNSFYFVPRSMG